MILILAFSLIASRCFSEDYRGADGVLQSVAASTGKPVAGTEATDTPAKLKHDLKNYRATSGKMAPDQAAESWVKFVDRFLSLHVDRDSVVWYGADPTDLDSDSITFQQVVASLPPPPAWDPLVKRLQQRATNKELLPSTLVLTAMAHWLKGDVTGSITDLQSLSTAPTSHAMNEYYAISGIQSGLIRGSDNGDEVLAVLRRRVQNDAKAGYAPSLQVPDLITLLGEEKATDFLREALRTEKAEISVQGGEATRKLARKLALAMVAELPVPQWSLAKSLDSTELYEALTKKFPSSGQDRYERQVAQSYYLLGLIAAHRSADAVNFAMTLTDMSRSISDEAISALERMGRTRDLAEFFHDLLEKNPNLPFWGTYVDLAAKAFETDKMVALAESAAHRQDLNEKQRRLVLIQLHRAYLAADKIDKAIEILRQEIAANHGGAASDSSDYNFSYREYDDPGLRLVSVGEVLDRKDLVEEGIRAVRQVTPVGGDARLKQKRVERLNRLAAELIGLNRGREAEDVLIEALELAPDLSKTQYSESVQPETLSLLVALYHRANRPADILTLLTKAPQWNAKDLSALLSRTVTIGRTSDYIAQFAADALLESGRSAEANQIVDALVKRHGGYDPAYEYLVKQNAASEMIPRLDQLFALDGFEERPLIWKARLLADQGKLDDAEKCARQAISIDPSDGEEGPGRRMQAYAVLADIREKQGDQKEADSMRKAVTAIRHSEDADRFYDAGLISRAVKMYEEALSHFSDAYCIQSRLALRMVETGDLAGAEEHYRRAYELMPDSFGRVESHCFGCERAFDGERAQSIAEKVFTELAAKRSDKPQVHYLLGYLRNIEGRYAEALPEFRQAVKLDPDYLNAWKELGDIGEKMHLPAADRESIEFSKLRLDPQGRHSSFRVSAISDFKKAWAALENAAQTAPKVPEKLFPLTASSEEMQRRQAMLGSAYVSRIYNGANDQTDPGSIFAGHPVMQGVVQWFNATLQSR